MVEDIKTEDDRTAALNDLEEFRKVGLLYSHLSYTYYHFQARESFRF